MTRLNATKARDQFSDLINRVSYRGERIVLERRGKDVMALVPVEDLALIEELEDRMDLEEARKRLQEPRHPWEELKAELGLAGIASNTRTRSRRRSALSRRKTKG